MAKRKTPSNDNEGLAQKNELKDSIENLLKVLIEQMEEQYFHEMESFESYSKRVHLKLYKDLDGFCDRFLKGYEVIVRELKDEGPKTGL